MEMEEEGELVNSLGDRLNST